MAHTLLGFHRYVCRDLTETEKNLQVQHGPLGRDNMSVFRNWSKKGTVVERVIRTVSDVFGPSGDHHGVRDRWEAHCSTNGIKSVIGNYKDNRFNALFQTAAEIIFHRDDFIRVLESVKAPNLKLKAVLADLKSDVIAALLQCLGIVYLKITGPFWNLVSYLELYQHVGELRSFLENTCENPHTMLQNHDGHWSIEDSLHISHVQYWDQLSRILLSIKDNDMELVKETIITISNAFITTIDKQLADFLDGGQYCERPSEKMLKRTHFGHLTNLGCEHHFGDLDSSQRRRPSASMHHHSSVQLLKRNGNKIMQWLSEMEDQKRHSLMKSARKGGKDLRIKHMQNERNVLKQIHKEMTECKKTVKRKTKSNHQERRRNRKRDDDELHQIDTCCDSECEQSYSDLEEESALMEKLPHPDTAITVNEYVAVAYQDSWYPGIVVNVDSENVRVSFMATTRTAGHFIWPIREDIQNVKKEFILKKGFISECKNSGRLWLIAENIDIQRLYNTYKKIYF